jgi:hypothetical protein
MYIVINDFNLSRNPLNFMFSVLIMALSNLNSNEFKLNFAHIKFHESIFDDFFKKYLNFYCNTHNYSNSNFSLQATNINSIFRKKELA